VVIPTRGRPQWLVRAVTSALSQSYLWLEVIVVVDGPDPETVGALRGMDDERLQLIELDEPVGGSEARNVGVRAACGEWVALLDDDDEWAVQKVQKQMEVAGHIRARYPIISSRLLATASDGNRILPRRLYSPGENVANYLFCRTGLSYGDGMLQTSTLLTRRSLLLEAPFLKGLKQHQDWDWLLKVAKRPDVEIAMLPEALTLMRVAGQGESVSRAADWKASLAWAKMARPAMGAKAYSFFVVTECVPRARKSGVGPVAQLRLLWESVWGGRFGFKQLVLFLCFSLPPKKAREMFGRLRMLTVSTTEWGEYERS
jgi:glycosyltransferase involved in cell wall biosynthesis